MGGMQLPYDGRGCGEQLLCGGVDQHRVQPAHHGQRQPTDGAWHTDLQKQVFGAQRIQRPLVRHHAPSEPQAGSSLSDMATRAGPDGEDFEVDPLGPRYRLRGNKMWISSGDHELTENIVHLVLAKIPGPDGKLVPGVKGISLFIVPKKLVDTDGQLTGERNDVALAGLNHKLGWRGTTNTLLNFGEGKYPVRGGRRRHRLPGGASQARA